MRVVICSGYFDPIGAHHIKLFKSAKELFTDTYLIVGINSDAACSRKKGQPPFMSWNDKYEIVNSIRFVNKVMAFDDADGSACDLLRIVSNDYPNDEIIFANGGDRSPDNIPIPEEGWAKIHLPNIKFLYGIGGWKTGSSSDLLRKWTLNTNRLN